jgi:hypothetical protein
VSDRRIRPLIPTDDEAVAEIVREGMEELGI